MAFEPTIMAEAPAFELAIMAEAPAAVVAQPNEDAPTAEDAPPAEDGPICRRERCNEFLDFLWSEAAEIT